MILKRFKFIDRMPAETCEREVTGLVPKSAETGSAVLLKAGTMIPSIADCTSHGRGPLVA